MAGCEFVYIGVIYWMLLQLLFNDRRSRDAHLSMDLQKRTDRGQPPLWTGVERQVSLWTRFYGAAATTDRALRRGPVFIV